MKKKVFSIIITIFVFINFSSCQETAQSDSQISQPVSQQAVSRPDNAADVGAGQHEQRHIGQTLSSDVVVDADILIPAGLDFGDLPVIEAKILEQNYERAKDLLLAADTIIYDEIDEEATISSMIGSPYRLMETESQFYLASHGEYLRYGGELSTKIYSIIYDSVRNPNNYYNKDTLAAKRDLSFSPVSDAQIAVGDFMAALGIEVCATPVSIYSFDKEMMTQEQDRIFTFYGEYDDVPIEHRPVKYVFTADDECYLFYFQTAVDGMPVSMSQNGTYGDGSLTSGTRVEVLYSKDGIVGFDIIYQFQKTETLSEGQKGMSVEEALDCLDQKYNSILMEGDYLVTGIEFEYAPMPVKGSENTYTLVPAWRFHTEHRYPMENKDGSGETFEWIDRSQVIFHAVTGEEMPTDLGDI